MDELRQLQDDDVCYWTIKRGLCRGLPLQEIRYQLKKLKSTVKWSLDEMIVEGGLLLRKCVKKFGEEGRVVYLPRPYIEKSLMLSHSSPTAGHGGVNVSLTRCQSLATWPSMKQNVENYVRWRVVCCRFKQLGNHFPAPLRHYPDVTAPFERIHVDLVGPLGVSDDGYRYLMTVIDVLTRYLIAVPLRSKEAQEVVRALCKEVICMHGVPVTIVTDQGREFINTVLSDVAKELMMSHARITAFHPSANGVVERANTGWMIEIMFYVMNLMPYDIITTGFNLIVLGGRLHYNKLNHVIQGAAACWS